MRKPRNIARYSPGLALAALTTVTTLALGHVARAVKPAATGAQASPLAMSATARKSLT